MSSKDSFGDRMKLYEKEWAGRKFLPLLPVCARLDGKCFSTFTKGLDRPYDKGLSDLMIDCTLHLVEETNARMGYTQSDEISLVWFSDDIKSQIFFDAKIQKMTSVLSSMLTAYFNRHLQWACPSKINDFALFDCRVWQVPNKVEAANTFLWREMDATKNSISMAASHYYSHKKLMNKNGDEKQEMLFQKGVNWNDYPSAFKRGTFVQRKKVCRPFTKVELCRLPSNHDARKNPDLIIERSEVKALEVPPFGKVTNRSEVIFDGADPILAPEENSND
jgi:tRNA(His) 5'-end guanylyltransferase